MVERKRPRFSADANMPAKSHLANRNVRRRPSSVTSCQLSSQFLKSTGSTAPNLCMKDPFSLAAVGSASHARKYRVADNSFSSELRVHGPNWLGCCMGLSLQYTHIHASRVSLCVCCSRGHIQAYIHSCGSDDDLQRGRRPRGWRYLSRQHAHHSCSSNSHDPIPSAYMMPTWFLHSRPS